MMLFAKSLMMVVYIGFVVLATAGCASSAVTTPVPSVTTPPSTSPTTTTAPLLATSAKDIVGTWVGIGTDGLYQSFNEDGTCQTATLLDNLATKPDVESTFRFEGTHFILTEVMATGLPSCSSKPGTYEIQLLTNGNIKFIRIQDSCAGRAKSTAQEHKPVR